jgi:hypothetical protein
LEGLVKLARRQKNEEHRIIPMNTTQQLPTIHHININKNHKNKILHLMVGINNYIVEGFVDIKASMFMLVVVVVRELRIMHLVMGSKSYKIASSVVTQTFGKIEGLPVWIGETSCNMVLMVIDTDSCNMLLGLDF